MNNNPEEQQQKQEANHGNDGERPKHNPVMIVIGLLLGSSPAQLNVSANGGDDDNDNDAGGNVRIDDETTDGSAPPAVLLDDDGHDEHDEPVDSGSTNPAMTLLYDPDIVNTVVESDAEYVKEYYDFVDPEEVQRLQNCLGSWVLRLDLDSKRGGELRQLSFVYYQIRMKDVLEYIPSKFGSDVHVIHEDDNSEHHSIRIRVFLNTKNQSETIKQEIESGTDVKSDATTTDSSFRRLTQIKEALVDDTESLPVQVSSFVWFNMSEFRDRQNRGNGDSSDGMSTGNIQPIDWKKFQNRLESYPLEAAYPQVISNEIHLHAGWQKSHPSILHALCFETCSRMGPFEIPLSVLKGLIEAFPSAVSMISEDFNRRMPLHHVLDGMSRGTSDLTVEHVRVLLDAYPGAASALDVHRDNAAIEIDSYPIQILCSYGTAIKWAMRGTALSRRVIVENFNDERLETIQLCTKCILDTMDPMLLLKMEEFSHPLHLLTAAYRRKKYDVETELLSRINNALATTYMILLRATHAAASSKLMDNSPSARRIQNDVGLLQVALNPKHGGRYFIGDILPKILEVIDISSLARYNDDGLLPLHVAIQNCDNLNPRMCLTHIDSCIDVILQAEPKSLLMRDVRNGLYPFMLAAIGAKCQVNTIYHLLRKDPSVMAIIGQRESPIGCLSSSSSSKKRKWEE